MTTDRKKAVFFLSITLIVGILIGALVPSFYGRMRKDDSRRGRNQRSVSERRIGFERMIYRVIEADSSQKEKIQPIFDATAVKIEALEKNSSERMIEIMDSMKMAMKPVLSEEQMNKLEDFSKKARARRRGQ